MLNHTRTAHGALAFDQPAYAHGFPHVGEPVQVGGWPSPLLVRKIPGSDRQDAVAPWPYVSAPGDAAAVTAAANALRGLNAVTFQAVLRPDEPVPSAALVAAGFCVTALKTHYVYRPDGAPLTWSEKTRANVRRARRQWDVVPVELAQCVDFVAAAHDELTRRRGIHGVVALPPVHFTCAAQTPGFECLIARDSQGPAAGLVVALTPGRVHFHSMMGHEHAYRQRAFYALFDATFQRWGQTHVLHLGGAPRGPAQSGVAKFKRRFANEETTATMVTAVLDPAACAHLAAGRTTADWFPPYRSPNP